MINKKTIREKKTKSFLCKLYDILNDLEYGEIISWNKEGNGVIIKNITKLCKIVLPKFYKHKNYSSFVRQLNIYGFYKSQGILKDGEGFEHDIFNKNITKEQIKQIFLYKNQKKIINNNNNTGENESKIKALFENKKNITNNDYFKLYEEEKNNSDFIKQLKEEFEDLRSGNKLINDNLKEYQNIINGHKIFLEKILKRKNNNNSKNHKNFKKSLNIKELFTKYLYYLHIYSPYVSLLKTNGFHTSYSEIRNEINTNTINYNNIIEINSNFIDDKGSFLEKSSFLKYKRNIDNNNSLNINDNISSFSSIFFVNNLNNDK